MVIVKRVLSQSVVHQQRHARLALLDHSLLVEQRPRRAHFVHQAITRTKADKPRVSLVTQESFARG